MSFFIYISIGLIFNSILPTFSTNISEFSHYYPCQKYFVFIIDQSYGLTIPQFKAQINLVKNYILNTAQWNCFDRFEWNHFENLALISYASEVKSYPFGSFRNLSSIHDALDSIVQQNYAPKLYTALYTASYLTPIGTKNITQTLLFTSVNDPVDIGKSMAYSKQLTKNGVFTIVGMNQADEQLLLELEPKFFTMWTNSSSSTPNPTWLPQFLLTICPSLKYPCGKNITLLWNSCTNNTFLAKPLNFTSNFLIQIFNRAERFATSYINYEAYYRNQTINQNFGSFRTMDYLKNYMRENIYNCRMSSDVNISNPYTKLLKSYSETFGNLSTISPTEIPLWSVDYNTILFITPDKYGKINPIDLHLAQPYAAQIPNLIVIAIGNISYSQKLSKNTILWSDSDSLTPDGDWYSALINGFECGKNAASNGNLLFVQENSYMKNKTTLLSSYDISVCAGIFISIFITICCYLIIWLLKKQYQMTKDFFEGYQKVKLVKYKFYKFHENMPELIPTTN